MDRRQLLKRGTLAAAAFAFSRDLFASEVEKNLLHSVPLSDIIKLSSNENPHGPSPTARKAMMEMVNQSNRYPWEITTELREKIASVYQLTKEHITVGAGSSELLGVVSLMAALQKGNAIAPDPTFRLWMPAAKTVGLPVKLVPVTANKETDLQQMKDAMDKNTKMVYLCNPGNPTGAIIPANDLEIFIKEITPTCILLLDEAYTEFSNEPTMARWVNEYPNLIIAKTFSKVYGMAGARAGFAIAHPATIKKMNELQPWANAGISTVTLAGAIASLSDQDFVHFCRKENEKAKTVFCTALENTGMKYIRSHTSFVYFDTAHFKKDVKDLLEANKIIGCRTFENGTSWRRLSIGTVDEMKKVALALTSA